jgi:hypothetical protein
MGDNRLREDSLKDQGNIKIFLDWNKQGSTLQEKFYRLQLGNPKA